MNHEQFISELESYHDELLQITRRFNRTRGNYHIQSEDDPHFRALVIEIIDLLNDELGSNKYSGQISNIFQTGVANYLRSPSYKSIEDISSTIKAIITRVKRNPEIVGQKNKVIKTQNKPTDNKSQKNNKEFNNFYELFINSNYKVRFVLIGISLACFVAGVTLGQSALYAERIAPMISLYKKSAADRKNATEPSTPKKITELTNK